MFEPSLYWLSTLLLSLLYLLSATLYIVRRDWARQGLVDLGYPEHLMWFLTTVKSLAVLAITSRFSVALSDLAYAGVFYHLLLSALAYVGLRNPRGALPALIGLVLLAVSFTTQNSAREMPSPYLPVTATYSLSTH